MTIYSLDNDGISCWICVLQNRDTSDFQIIYTLNVHKYLQEADCRVLKLVYCRKFGDLLDGIGHKLFLEELSSVSLKRFVLLHNPEYVDLRKKKREELRTKS